MYSIHVFQLSEVLWRRGVAVAASLLFIHYPQPQARSAEIQWNGGFNSSWHQVFNWDFFGSPFSIRRIPTDTDTAHLLTPAGDDVFLFGDTEPINGLIVSNSIDLSTNGFLLEVDNAGSGAASIAGASRLYVDPRVGGGNAMETDNLLLTGGGILQLNGGDALVQGNTTIFGNSRVQGTAGAISFGGDVSVINSSVLRLLNGPTATFAPGTTVSAEGSSIIDLDQTVNVINGITFEIKSSARMEASTLNIGTDRTGNIGERNGSDGTLLIDQAGGAGVLPRLEVSQDLTIGDTDTGTALIHVKNSQASIEGRTFVNATGSLLLDGSQFGANDDILMRGGKIMTSNQDDPIFLYPGAKLNAFQDSLVTIDGNQSVHADVTFQFLSGTQLVVTGNLKVGADLLGTGTLVVNGFDTTAHVGSTLLLGEMNGMTGMATISTGAESTANSVQVGLGGTGILEVKDFSVLSSASGQVGVNSGSSGTATVSGAGAEWNVTNSLAVGSSGNGNLTVTAGGRVTSVTGYLGADSSGMGVATLTGTNSNWTMTGNLLLGGGQLGDLGGSGTLNVQPGASVIIGNTIRLYTKGVLNLTGGTLTTPTFDYQGGTFNWTSGTLHVETYPQNLVNQGGILAPGESAGSTTILGNYTQQSDAELEIEIGGTSAGGTYDLVGITGSAVLDGDLLLSLIDGFVPELSDTFTVLNATGGIVGVFDNVTTGQRLATSDGLGSFLVHYGAGSPNLNQIVLSQFLPSFTADFDKDFDVDHDDLTEWQSAYGAGNGADADADGDSDGDDFLAWQRQFGSGPSSQALFHVVPEPRSPLVLIFALVYWLSRVGRAECRRPAAATTLLILILWLGACTKESQAQNPLEDAYTYVQHHADIPANVGTLQMTTLNGSTDYDETFFQHPLVPIPGQYNGVGYAGFTQLRASGELFGKSAVTGRTFAAFNEIHTPMGGPLGTPGEMTFVFTLDGTARADAIMGAMPTETTYAHARLGAYQSTLDNPQGTELGLYLMDFETTPAGPNSVTQYRIDYGESAMFTVPFTYGESFSLFVILRVWSFLDNELVDRVVIDFSNTAELVAIVNEENPGMILVGASGVDYTPLVTDEYLIPEPTSLVLFTLTSLSMVLCNPRVWSVGQR